MQTGRIIFLNGTSSAGKSTLAKALRAALREPFCYYASDQLAEAGFRTIKHADAPDERAKFFDGFHRSIAAFAEGGNDLIVEHIVEEASWWQQLQQLLEHLDTFWIGVHAPLAEIERRERERGDRSAGEGRYHLKTHDYCQYDIEIDTSQAQDLVISAIASAWRGRPTIVP